jgi:hypothetical protein
VRPGLKLCIPLSRVEFIELLHIQGLLHLSEPEATTIQESHFSNVVGGMWQVYNSNYTLQKITAT